MGVFWIFYLEEFWGFFFFLDGHVGGDGRRITEILKGFSPAFQTQTEAGAAKGHTLGSNVCPFAAPASVCAWKAGEKPFKIS